MVNFAPSDEFPAITAVFYTHAPVVEQPDTVDSAEAAAMLGITLNNLRQMVFRKRLVPVGKDGRRSLFAREQVAVLVESRRKEPDAQD